MKNLKTNVMQRKVDALGRIVIPYETRREMNIKSGESMVIILDNQSIILLKDDGTPKSGSIIIIRKIDELGRVVLPMIIRNKLKIKENDLLNIELKENSVILNK